MDIIFISMSSWDNDISSAAFSLAKELSKTHRVFYFDNPFTFKDFIVDFRHPKIKSRLRNFFFSKRRDRHLPEMGQYFHAVTPSLTIPINFLPTGRVYRFFLRINRRILQRNLTSLIQHQHISQYIFFNSFNPFYHSIYSKPSAPSLIVYQSRDDISQITYGSKHGVLLEKESIQSSDISFATSKALTRKLEKFTGCSINYLPNAVDINSFPDQILDIKKPIDIAHIQKDIICYIGNLDQRIDYHLLYQIAVEHTDKVLLLVGPRNDDAYHNYDFESLANVVFTGPKPHNQLYRYLKFASCTIIPFVKNVLTASIYPLKINEYLAMGKSVITTDFSEDVLSFSSVCYLSEDHQSFLELIRTGISDGEDPAIIQKRIDFAKDNSWEARIASFWKVVDPLIHSS